MIPNNPINNTIHQQLFNNSKTIHNTKLSQTLVTLMESTLFHRSSSNYLSKKSIQKSMEIMNILSKELILQDGNQTQNQLPLKLKGYILQILTSFLSKVSISLVKDLTEFKIQTFTVKSWTGLAQTTRAVASEHKKKKRRSVNQNVVKQNALFLAQKQVQQIIESSLSSQKNIAQIQDITLRKQGIQNDTTLKHTGALRLHNNLDDSIGNKDLDFKSILDHTLLKNWQLQQRNMEFHNQFEGIAPMSAEKQLLMSPHFVDKSSSKKKVDQLFYSKILNIADGTTIMNTTAKDQQQRIAKKYKQLLTGDQNKQNHGRSANKKTQKKKHYLPQNSIKKGYPIMDIIIDDISRQQLSMKDIINSDFKITKKKKQQNKQQQNQINLLELKAPQLQDFVKNLLTVQDSSFKIMKDQILQFQKNLILGNSLLNSTGKKQRMRFESTNRKGFSELQLSNNNLSNKSAKSSSLGDYDRGQIQLQNNIQDLSSGGPHLTTINQVTGLYETTQFNQQQPIQSFKNTAPLSQIQKKINTIVTRSSRDGKVGLNQLLKQQRLTQKKAKSMFFYQLLGMGYNLKQDQPQKFGQIIISLDSTNYAI